MEFNHTNMVAGLYTKGVEFVAVTQNKVEALHNRQVLPFEFAPSFAHDTIKKLMGSQNPSMEEMEAFAFNRWGGLDNMPDIDENGNPGEPEYLVDVTPAYYDNGNLITEGAMRVLRLARFDDMTIADKLFISKFTVARHFATIYSELQIEGNHNRRVYAHDWAKSKGII